MTERSFAAFAVCFEASHGNRARTPEQGALLRLGAFATLTGVLGVLGTIVGLQASVEYLNHVDAKWVFLIGLRESLNNLVLALVFIVIDLLIVAQRGMFGSPARTPVVELG